MKKLFMAPAPEDWMKIYRKLQLRAGNVSSQNPCYIFNPSALPSPEVFDDFSYHSEFEKAMHWRFTVLWARQHNLLAVIEDAQGIPGEAALINWKLLLHPETENNNSSALSLINHSTVSFHQANLFLSSRKFLSVMNSTPSYASFPSS